jgi:hypothetical protein
LSPTPQSVQIPVVLHSLSIVHFPLINTEVPKQAVQTDGWLSAHEAQGIRQLSTHFPTELGENPGMHCWQLFPLHTWHLSGHGSHLDPTS